MASEVESELGFQRIGRLISGNDTDSEWVAACLRDWMWPQEKTPVRLRNQPELGFFKYMVESRWSRKELLSIFKEKIPHASGQISELLRDFAVASYLTDEQFGVGFDFVQITQIHVLLHELKRRCEAISQSTCLVSDDGKARAGRGITLAPDQVDERVACASAVAVAWKFVRGEYPGPYVRDAGEAANLLFELGMAPPGRFDLVEKRRESWGSQSNQAQAWPPYFKKARKPNAMLAKFNGMLEERLRHFLALAGRAPPVDRSESPQLKA